MKELCSLTYISNSAVEMNSESIKVLLNNSRAFNSENNISGILMMLDNKFIQVLEGELELVIDLYTKIEQDPRHKDLLILLNMKIKERTFKDWSMGFVKLENDEFSEESGFTNIDQFIKGLSSRKTWDPSLEFLKKFYFSNRLTIQ